MAAPQIPNLLESLRKSKASGNTPGLRGGPRRGPGAESSSDAVIQQTDDDAAGSRLSAVDVGYLHDPFAKALSSSKQRVRRMPIINRGTYVRTVAIDALVKQFMDVYRNQGMQIISLGAGTDTRPFRLLDQHHGMQKKLLYHEIDFADCTRKKVKAVQNTELLADLEMQVSKDGSRLSSPTYHLHPLDLRKLSETHPTLGTAGTGEGDEGDKWVSENGINSSQPTLLLSECCLTYFPSSTAISVLQYFLRTVLNPSVPVHIVLYEPLHPNDAFGQIMTSNLSARGIALPGLEACPTIEAHRERLESCGFETADGVFVRDWWNNRITADEKDRLRSLEGLDEEEEWELLAGHYGFIWGSRGDSRWPDF